MRSSGAIAVAAALALAGACGARSTTAAMPFQLVFHATNDRGEPLPDVAVTIAGQAAGTTGADGLVSVDVAVEEGTTAPVGARCPDRFLAAQMIDTVTFRTLRSIADGSTSTKLAITIVCPRAERVAALVVRADGHGGIPVLVNGRRRAVTDDSGIAHVGLAVSPHAPVRVTLDTADRPRLRPQDPEVIFTMGEADDLFLFDQPFETKARQRKKERKKPEPKVEPEPAPQPEPPKPTRPIRVR